MSKSKAQKRHALVRIEQRYGLRVSSQEYEDACERIRAGEGKFIARQSKRVSIWDVVIRGRTVRVVYDKQRGFIASALPKNAWE